MFILRYSCPKPGISFIEAFQHLVHLYLICKHCFMRWCTVKKDAEFVRISLLKESM